MSTGYFSGGRELSPREAAALRLPSQDRTAIPRYTVPRYSTGGRLFTRDELVSVFRMDWHDYQATAGDVHNYVRHHFGESMGPVKPTDYVPYHSLPEITTETDTKTVQDLLNEWMRHREASMKARELFCLDGLPKFIPSGKTPSNGDTADIMAREVADIEREPAINAMSREENDA